MDKIPLKKIIIIGLAAAIGYGLFGKLGVAVVLIWVLMK